MSPRKRTHSAEPTIGADGVEQNPHPINTAAWHAWNDGWGRRGTITMPDGTVREDTAHADALDAPDDDSDIPIEG